MKVLVNGGLNLSELDGWWAEAYTPEVGWALGDGQEHGDDPAWDAVEAEALYELLEHQIIPEFYTRDAHGIPIRWVARMRESMATLTPRFSSGRVLREYTERYYLPTATSYRGRAADHGAAGARLAHWCQVLEQQWDGLRFGRVEVTSNREQHTFEVQVFLGGLAPEAVEVELYAAATADAGPVRQAMARVRPLEGSPDGDLYRATVPAARPAAHYTPRAIPRHPDVALPLEDSHIAWQR
jgi:starch phosphorylase